MDVNIKECNEKIKAVFVLSSSINQRPKAKVIFFNVCLFKPIFRCVKCVLCLSSMPTLNQRK